MSSLSNESKIKTKSILKHLDTVTCVGYFNSELYSAGDDQRINKWSSDGDFISNFQTSLFDKENLIYITDLHWFPASVKAKAENQVCAVGSSDGRFYVINKAGRVEKMVEAHSGALLALKWNYEGSALLTAGEDGHVKIWSRSGMLRNVLIQTGNAVYSSCWSPENDQIILTSGCNIIIKPIQPSSKPNQWKAHDGIILKVDWNLANGLICSAGEDRKYKLWDSFGRLLFSSSPHDHPITCVSWNSSGEMFAVGGFNLLRICDRLGWSYALYDSDCGSISSIAWTPDGTQLACAGGNGSVVFGNLINIRLEWKNIEVTILQDHRILVLDVSSCTTETLDFRDRIVKASIAFNHLIVCTSSQIYVYSDKNWNTPLVADLNPSGRVICIKQCAEFFCIVDTAVGIQVFSYDARTVSNIKYLGLRSEYVTSNSISISGDTIAIKDRVDEKAIYLFDITTGKPINDEKGGPFRHYIEVSEIALNQSSVLGSNTGRQLVIVDKNRDMWVTGLKVNFKKLGTMVETFSWNDEIDMIAAMVDGKFIVWYYPSAFFVDEDIANLTRFERDGSAFGRDAQFVSFLGTQCTLRKANGALVTVSHISPYPALLHEQTRSKRWEDAVRLCRYAKMKELWACLAVMAVNGQDLNTAEVAYAMIQEPAKVQYICRIRDIPSLDRRNAEMALFRRQPKEAESILLSSSLIYRAIMMWVYLYQWDRALEIAVKYKTHVDTVLYFRRKYLRTFERKETNKRYIQVSEGVEVDEDIIIEKMNVEEERELHKIIR